MARTSSQRFGVTRVALLLAAMSVGLVNAVAVPVEARGTTLKVKHGQSIQSFIDLAKPGDKIVVAAGIYKEQLLIMKNGITLSGQGAILTPPDVAVTNICTDLSVPPEIPGFPAPVGPTQAGICISGTNVELGDRPKSEHRRVNKVGTFVKDVEVTGFEIRGFSGLNVAIVGAQNARVARNNFTDGAVYGALTVGSKGSVVTRNVVSVSPGTPPYLGAFIAICMDDMSDVAVTQNTISGYGIGLCVQTNKADVGHNKVSDCCIGAFVDPFVDGAQLTHNKIGPSSQNPFCGGFINGILIDGATNTGVRNNDVFGQTVPGAPPGSGAVGISLVDDPSTTPVAISSKNTIAHNDLSGNDFDFYINTSGAKNEVDHNKCPSCK